jgi:hypothetical protein
MSKGERAPSPKASPPKACCGALAPGRGDFSFGDFRHPHGNRHRTRHLLNQEFMQALLLNFRHQGKKAIEKVAREQPASYLKILALLVPREHKVEHRNLIKELSDEQLEAMVEYLKTSMEAQAGRSVRVIEGTIEPVAATAPAPKPKNRLMLEADTAVGPSERHRASGADLHRAKLHSSD